MDSLHALRAVAWPGRVTADEDLILIAHAVALRADCTRRRVGAVIIDTHGRVVGTGRNGAPPGYPGCLSAGACPRGRLTSDQVAPGSSYAAGGAGACIANHAETNAVLFSDPHARRGGTMGVTDGPCNDCARLLAGSGLARVIWPVTATAADGSATWTIREHLLSPGAPISGHYDPAPAQAPSGSIPTPAPHTVLSST